MKNFFKMICILTLLSGLVFSANKRILKSEMKMDKMKRVEPDYRRGSASRDVCPFQYPTNSNSQMTIIDSSANGYGMVATVTRPMDVNRYDPDGNMLVVYRQYVEPNTTHGQLGAAYSEVNAQGQLEWDVQYNLNYNGNPPWGGGGVGGTSCGVDGGYNCSQARYPSGIASADYPYAIWNEYTGGPPTDPIWPSECSDYGGRPYFSYDQFGWGGGSWLYPAELDPLYDCTKDLWQGSVSYGYDVDNNEHHVSVVYDDWTRTGSYLFRSEAVDQGYIVLGTETNIVNPSHLGTDGYSSSAILSMNGNGQGILGIDGIFAGNDMDAGTCSAPASNLTCNKTPMFMISDDFGQSWTGDASAFNFYYVGDDVFDNIVASWPTTDVDACTGEISTINDFWSWYEFDMRVDNYGNPHIVISLIAESDDYFHFMDGYTGFYHLTIDRDNLANPGPVNSGTGWNWSYIPLPANDSFTWNRPDGYSYLYGSMCQISISKDDDNIIYMVANIANQGTMDLAHDCPTTSDSCGCDGVEEDPCATQESPWLLYPEWSEDIWVAKSSDNGSTWTALENLSQTARASAGSSLTNMCDTDGDGVVDEICDVYGMTNDCAPDEQYAHAAHWSDDYGVYYQYNQPNWEFNEIGDPLGADCMNRVFIGYSWVEETGDGGCTDTNNCSYDPDAAFDNGSCGSGIYPCDDCSSGCGCDNVCGDTTDSPAVIGCDNVCDSGHVMTCNYVVDGGGETCDLSDPAVCTETTANQCEEYPDSEGCTNACDEENEINDWYDCNSLHCGTVDPLFGCDGLITWDGGRCYTCWNDDVEQTAITTEGECTAATYQWKAATVIDTGDLDSDGNATEQCNQNIFGCLDLYTTTGDCPTFVAEGDIDDGWVPFVDDGDDDNGEETDGPADECSCTAQGAQYNAEPACGADLGNLNGDNDFNVLDIVALANCVLAQNCGNQPLGCAGDMNGDGGWNVLDIVNLANCILAGTCAGRVDDATASHIIMRDNIVSIEANGFIGGVQMTLSHGADFSIEMTNRAEYADYLTEDNETRLLVITPETNDLFSYNGDFEIAEIIVANSHAEVSVDLPVASSFSLSDAYPNPFNPTTTLKLSMPLAGDMQVEVYNLLGQVVSTLVSGYMEADTYTLTWDATDVASGMYLVKAQTGGFTTTQKLMLVK